MPEDNRPAWSRPYVRAWPFRLRWLVALLVFSVSVAGCGLLDPKPPELSGRWKVISNQGLSVPETLFWFSMDYLEIREDGTLLSLINWPPDTDSEIRLNKRVAYERIDESQIAITGACHYTDPCTGIYDLSAQGNTLRLTGQGGELVLERVGPASVDIPPEIVGPVPSPTP